MWRGGTLPPPPHRRSRDGHLGRTRPLRSRRRQASADWTPDVTRLILTVGIDITTRTGALRKLLLALPLPVPESIDDAEFAKLGERINEIIASDGTRLKGLFEMQTAVKVDVSAKLPGIDGYRLRGKVIDL